MTDGFLDIISKYSKSFELLNRYDSEDLQLDNLSKEIIYVINYDDVKKAIYQLKRELVQKGEAGELFGNEKDDSFRGILGSISQTVYGELAYPTIEEQAANCYIQLLKVMLSAMETRELDPFCLCGFWNRTVIIWMKEE